MNKKRNIAAFTMVEILIGTAIVVALMAGLFRIFGSANKSSVQTIWYTQRQNGLRNLFQILQSDLARASGPSEVTDTSAQRLAWDQPENHLQFKSGLTTLAAGGAETELLRFKICKPSIQTSSESQSAEETLCVLRAFGTTLNYFKSGTETLNKDIVEDVAEFTLESLDNASSGATEGMNFGGTILNVEAKIVHSTPNLFPNAAFSEKVTARVPVESSEL